MRSNKKMTGCAGTQPVGTRDMYRMRKRNEIIIP